MSRPGLLLALVVAGCLPDRDLLDPVATSWGEEVAREARPAAQAALGLAAVAALLCPHSLDDWEAMGTTAPTLPEEITRFFGLPGDGVLHAYPARGQFACSWGGGSFFGEPVALKATVETPMSAFTVSLDQARPDEDTAAVDTGVEPEDASNLAKMVLAASQCGTERRLVTGSASFPVGGDLGWSVTLVPAADAEGMAFAADAGRPAGGGLAWSGHTTLGRATLRTHDAAEIEGDHWPATAGGRGWSAEASLDLP